MCRRYNLITHAGYGIDHAVSPGCRNVGCSAGGDTTKAADRLCPPCNDVALGLTRCLGGVARRGGMRVQEVLDDTHEKGVV